MHASMNMSTDQDIDVSRRAKKIELMQTPHSTCL
jgi:hypothetical protein